MKKRLFGLVAIPLIAIGSLTYANDFIVHDTTAGTITIYTGDFSYGITIQDKNLGATDVGDYGYYHQWGNNHGNPAGTNTGTLNELLDADVNERVNKGYSGNNDKFIIFDNGNKSTYDYRSGVHYTDETNNSYVGDSAYNNLWGGGNDNQTGDATKVKGYDTVNHVVINPGNRQGPCPDGYHVPSAGEWQELMMLWCNANPDICSGDIINSASEWDEEYAWANYLEDGDGIIGTAFSYDLQLPLAGNRNYDDGNVYDLGVGALYWSSSPRGGSYPKGAWGLAFLPNIVYPSSDYDRAYGRSLRCFKNSYVKLPKTLNLFFISDNEEVGTGEVTENKSFTGTIPSLRKDGYNLEYRYISGADASTGFDFENTPISGAWADESGNVYFIAQWTKIETKPSGGYSGGGGRSSSKDVISNDSEKSSEQSAGSQVDSSEQAPQNDNSVSSGAIAKDPEKDSPANASEGQNQQQFTQEFQEAYEFAKEKGITTMPTINDANMNGKLTRIAMAKMLSYYAINVLGQKPDETRINKFNDITEKLDAQYDSGVTLAYQLGIMGINMPDNKFRPNDEVTRAEFATALSRMLYFTPDGKPYYTTHLETLKSEGILKNDDYKMKELRGYVMIMLMRSDK